MRYSKQSSEKGYCNYIKFRKKKHIEKKFTSTLKFEEIMPFCKKKRFSNFLYLRATTVLFALLQN